MIRINPDGTMICLYTEKITLSELGQLDIKRASHVEPNEKGEWLSDLTPIDGPILGPFFKRSSALLAEIEWIEKNIIEGDD